MLRVTHPPLNKRKRRLRGDEETRLLNALEHPSANPLMRALVIVAIETAMRQGGLLSMNWADVDLEKSRTAYLPKTKNGEERTVPFSKRATAILNSLGQERSGQVFPVTQSAVIQAFDAARLRAGIMDLTFHDLRHEATSRLFERPMFNPIKVQAITGHKSMQMLLRYSHFDAKNLVSELDATDVGVAKHS